MKIRLLLLVQIMCLFLLLPAAQAEGRFRSWEEFNEWFTYYYMHPAPERIPDGIRYYCDSSMFEKANTHMPMAAFYTALLKEDNDLMRSVCKSITADGSDNSKVFLLNVLWLANTAESRKLMDAAKSEWKSDEMRDLIVRIEKQKPDNILSAPVKDPARLDMLWGTFLATGKAEPVKKIISVLHLAEDGHDMELILGSAAKWSLTSNARQHKRVSEICEEEAKKSTEPTKRLLETVVREAGQKGQKT